MAGCKDGDNKAQGQKCRRPEGLRIQAGLALLLPGRRPALGYAPSSRLARPAWARKQHPSELSHRLLAASISRLANCSRKQLFGQGNPLFTRR